MERIAQRFKDIQKKGANLADGVPNDEKWLPPFSDEKDIPKVDKGKGKGPMRFSRDPSHQYLIEASSLLSPPEPPEPIILAGIIVTLYVLPGAPLCIPCCIWTSGLGSWFVNLCEPKPKYSFSPVQVQGGPEPEPD